LNDPAGVQRTLVHTGMTFAQAVGQIDNLTQRGSGAALCVAGRLGHC